MRWLQAFQKAHSSIPFLPLTTHRRTTLNNSRGRLSLGLMTLIACASCSYVFANFIPVIDTPTPEERQASSHFYALYPDGNDQTGKNVTPPSHYTMDGGVVLGGDNIRHSMRDGWTYCRNIEQHAARSSNAWAFEGLVFLGAGIAGSTAGAKQTLDGKVTRDDFAVLGGGVLLLGAGVYALQRSSSAAKASSMASLGMISNSSDAAFASCIAARSQWISDREAANIKAELTMFKFAEKAFGASVLDSGSSIDGGSSSQ